MTTGATALSQAGEISYRLVSEGQERRSRRPFDRPCGPSRRRRPCFAVLRAKRGEADPTETCLYLVSKVSCGALSESSPFAHRTQDFRAPWLLRPPSGSAYDSLFARSWM